MNRPVLWFGLGMIVMLTLIVGGIFAVRLALADTRLRLLVDGDIDVTLHEQQPSVTTNTVGTRSQQTTDSTSTQGVVRVTPSTSDSPEDAEPGLSPTLRSLEKRDGGIRNALRQLYDDLIPTAGDAQATLLPTLVPNPTTSPTSIATTTSTTSTLIQATDVVPTPSPTPRPIVPSATPKELDEVVAATATILPPHASSTRRAPIANTIVPPTAELPEFVVTSTPASGQLPTARPIHPPILATHAPTVVPPPQQATALPTQAIQPTQPPKVETPEPTEPAHNTPRPTQPPKVETPRPTEPGHDTPKPTQPPKVETPEPTELAHHTPQPTQPPKVETPRPTEPGHDTPKPTDVPPATRVPETALPVPTAEPTHESGSHETPEPPQPTDASHEGHGHGSSESTPAPQDTPHPEG